MDDRATKLLLGCPLHLQRRVAALVAWDVQFLVMNCDELWIDLGEKEDIYIYIYTDT